MKVFLKLKYIICHSYGKQQTAYYCQLIYTELVSCQQGLKWDGMDRYGILAFLGCLESIPALLF